MTDDQQNPRQTTPIPPNRTVPMQAQTNPQAYQTPVSQPAAYTQGHHGKQKGTGGAKTFFLAFAGAAVACLIAFFAMSAFNSSTGKSATGSVVLGSSDSTTINATDSGEDRAEAVADKALPSVVAIDVYTNQSSSYSSLFGGTSSSSSTLTQSSLGSGVIISSDGYIITNYHVVEGAAALKVTANGEEYDATVVGTDESSDLAVIKIEATNLTAIEIGSSANLKTGQWVMTVGSPFGLEQSVATGIVSATSRTVVVSSNSSSSQYYSSSSSASSIYTNMIQTDAAINPGNSGGALVDQNGKLIGINAVIESYSGSYSGVGFAIPVDYAIDIAQQIIAGKTPTHAQLGVAATTITSSIAQRYGLSSSTGAYISKIYSGSGAEAAGLQQGDIITKIDSTTVSSATDLIAAVRSKNIGDTVTVTYVRDGSTSTVQAKLGSDESTSSSTSKQSSSSTLGSLFGNSSSNGSSTGASYEVDDGEEALQAAA